MVHALVDPATFVATDKATYPIVATGTQAAPTGLAGGERWTIASVVVAGKTLACNLSVNIDLGVEVVKEGCNSDIYDRSVRINAIKPVIRIRGKDIASFLATEIPIDGIASTHATTEIFLRKRTQSVAGFVADATAEHIKITADGAAHWTTLHDGTGNGRLESELQIDCRHDGTNVPVVIAVDEAIA